MKATYAEPNKEKDQIGLKRDGYDRQRSGAPLHNILPTRPGPRCPRRPHKRPHIHLSPNLIQSIFLLKATPHNGNRIKWILSRRRDFPYRSEPPAQQILLSNLDGLCVLSGS
jgi:hypothetical protein